MWRIVAIGSLNGGGVQGTPPGSSNPALLSSAALSSMDLDTMPDAGSSTMEGSGMPAPGPVGQSVSNPDCDMLSGPASIRSMGMPIGNPRTSAAESVSSVSNRTVTGASMPATGMPNGSLTERSADGPNSLGLGNGFASAGMPSEQGSGGEERGQRIWKGDLHLRGERNDMMVPCVAVQCFLHERTPLRDASGWPSELQCDATRLKNSTHVLDQMRGSVAQWYVRFAPVDANGNEKMDAKLIKLIDVMVDKKLAFEIVCEEPGGTPGILYLWGMPVPLHGHSLLGVFRPHPTHQQRRLDVVQELQMIMAGADFGKARATRAREDEKTSAAQRVQMSDFAAGEMVPEETAVDALLNKIRRLELTFQEFKQSSETTRLELQVRLDESERGRRELEQRHEALTHELVEIKMRGLRTEQYLDAMRRHLLEAISSRQSRVLMFARAGFGNVLYYFLAYLVPVFAFLVSGVRDLITNMRRRSKGSSKQG